MTEPANLCARPPRHRPTPPSLPSLPPSSRWELVTGPDGLVTMALVGRLLCPDVRARGSLCAAGMGEELPGVADDRGTADPAVRLGQAHAREDALPRRRGP